MTSVRSWWAPQNRDMDGSAGPSMRHSLYWLVCVGLLTVSCAFLEPFRDGVRTEASRQPETIGPRQELVSRELLVADDRQLTRILEESNPDPFSGGSGRVAFFRRIHDIVDAIPPEGMTREKIFALLRPLVASIRDGHTFLIDGGVGGAVTDLRSRV